LVEVETKPRMEEEMTIREAMVESMKRLGFTDIQERLDFSDLCTPEAREITRKPVPKGREELVISELMKVYEQLHSDPGFRQGFVEWIKGEEEKRNRNQ
jgi:uncharacterized protein YcaQ